MGDPQGQEEPDEIVENLDPTEDGESGEEAHRSTDQAQSCLRCHLYIFVFVYLYICTLIFILIFV